MNFQDFSKNSIQQLHDDIQGFINACQLPQPLHQASLYAMTNGGKRVRPLLVATTFATLQPNFFIDNQTLPNYVRRAMIAVECLHGYSLVHDDLPCMDNDDLRRGRPTCHVAFGEATALLVGDILQTLAFDAFTHDYFIDNSSHLTHQLLAIFAPRAKRMVIGQMLDLNGENQQLNQTELEAIHQDKTGALIEASVLMGAVCGHANQQQLIDLASFAKNIGLAFQVQDDILDVVSDTQQLGKPVGSDEKLDKSTYVKLLGIESARIYAEQLFHQAKQSIQQNFGEKNLLLDLVNWLWTRKY